MIDPSKLPALIRDAETDDNDLTTRMEKDDDLIFDVPYVMQGYKDAIGNSKPVPRVFNVNIPEAPLLLQKVVSMLVGHRRTTEILSYDDSLDDNNKEKIIDFTKDVDHEIDYGLNLIGEWPAEILNNTFLCARGWGSEQILCGWKDGEFFIDLRPLDRRWLTYGYGKKGLEWAAYTMRRSREKILEKYGREIKQRYGFVRDVWTTEKEYVYIHHSHHDHRTGNERIARSFFGDPIVLPNPYGFVPFTVEPVPIGIPIKGSRNNEHIGESIFWPHRDLFEEINFNASLLKSQAFDDFRAALQKVGEGDAPDEYFVSQSLTVDDQLWQLVPRHPLSNTHRFFKNIIDDFTQRAGLAATRYGNVPFPMSAVALEDLAEGEDSLYGPRLNTWARMLQARYRMIFRQAVKLNETGSPNKISIGEEYMKREYSLEELKGAYIFQFKFINDSLKRKAARISIGQSARGILSDKTIRREYGGVDNPEAEDDQIERETAKRLIPEIQLFEQCEALIDKKTPQSDIEAIMVETRLLDLLRFQLGSGVRPIQPEEKPTPKQTMQVFQQGGSPARGEDNAEV